MLHPSTSPGNSSKTIQRNISGVLLFDKPYGISSNQAVQKAKRIFSATKCGHTGTLDPLATGLLPLCFGEATKFSSILLAADKTYETTLKLGFSSTTGDAEGEISPLISFTADPALLHCENVLGRFVGKIQQVPPMYSALKHQGKPLYAYARKGTAIERPARDVHIYEILINELNKDELKLSIRCGTGTYVRTLAEDIGKALGYGGAYLTQLRRTAINCFDVLQAHTLIKLDEMAVAQRDECILPVDCLLQKFPAIMLDETTTRHIVQGRIINNTSNITTAQERKTVRLYTEQQQFLGLGEVTHEQTIVAKRLLANSELF